MLVESLLENSLLPHMGYGAGMKSYLSTFSNFHIVEVNFIVLTQSQKPGRIFTSSIIFSQLKMASKNLQGCTIVPNFSRPYLLSFLNISESISRKRF